MIDKFSNEVKQKQICIKPYGLDSQKRKMIEINKLPEEMPRIDQLLSFQNSKTSISQVLVKNLVGSPL